MKLKAQFRVSGQKNNIQKMKAKWTLTLFGRLLIIQKIRQLILLLLMIILGVAPFSSVVNVDGIKTLDEEETSPFTLAVLCRYGWR